MAVARASVSRGFSAPAAAGASTSPSKTATKNRRHMRRRLVPTKTPELVPGEVEWRDEDDRDRLCQDLVEAERHERRQPDQVPEVGQKRHDEKAHALVADVPALAAEGPEAVPGVVVRDGDEEGARRGEPVVEPGAEEERRVDREVDDVPGRADRAELRQLDPVVRLPERASKAGAGERNRRLCGGGGLPGD